MVSFNWSDKGNAWREAGFLEHLLAVLVPNPFSPLIEMDLGRVDNWQPYSLPAALAYWAKGREARITLRSGGDRSRFPVFETTINRRADSNGIAADVRDASLGNNTQMIVTPFIRQVASSLPAFYHASSMASDTHINQFYREQGLPELPAKSFIFYLGWYYLLSPESYQQDYTAADLLAAPAYSVQDLGNGNIEMLCYEHPLQYNTPESQQRIIELTRYLDAHRKR